MTQTDTNVPTAPTMTKEMLEASLFTLFPDELDRKNAMEEMSSVYGIDMETGLALPDHEAAENRKTAMESYLEQSKALENEAKDGKEGEADGKAAADGDGKEDGKAQEPDPEVERLRRELAEQQNRLAAIEGDRHAQEEAERRAEAERKAAEAKKADEDMQAMIDEARENYGEDYVKPMQAMFDQQKQMREQMAAAAKQEPEPQDQGDQTEREALYANPDLVSWLRENGDNWKKAVEIDDKLRVDPEWMGKPYADRFAAVVERVKAEGAAPPSGSAEDAKKSDTPSEPKPKEAATQPPPASLTDLGPGGPVDDAGKVWEAMTPIDMFHSGLDVNEMDAKFERIIGES